MDHAYRIREHSDRSGNSENISVCNGHIASSESIAPCWGGKANIHDFDKLQLGLRLIGTGFHMCEMHTCVYLYFWCRWYKY